MRLVPADQFLLFDFCFVEFDSVAGAGGKCEMGLRGDRRGLLEVVVRSHLEDEVFRQRTDRGGLAGNQVQGRMQAVPVRDHGDIEEGSNGADLQQFGSAAAPLRVALDYAESAGFQVVINFPSTLYV